MIELLRLILHIIASLFKPRTKLVAEILDAVAGLVGIEGGVVSGVLNLESSGVEGPDWRPRHDER